MRARARFFACWPPRATNASGHDAGAVRRAARRSRRHRADRRATRSARRAVVARDAGARRADRHARRGAGDHRRVRVHEAPALRARHRAVSRAGESRAERDRRAYRVRKPGGRGRALSDGVAGRRRLHCRRCADGASPGVVALCRRCVSRRHRLRATSGRSPPNCSTGRCGQRCRRKRQGWRLRQLQRRNTPTNRLRSTPRGGTRTRGARCTTLRERSPKPKF